MSFITQDQMFHPVVGFIRREGIVTLQQIHGFVRKHFNLTPQNNPEDFVPIGTHEYRYENQASNLKSTDVIVNKCSDIKHVKDGFATDAYLAQHPEVEVQLVRRRYGPHASVGKRVYGKQAKGKKADQWSIINMLWTLYKADADAQNNTYMMLVRNRDAIIGEVLKLKLAMDDREGIKEGIKAATAKYLPKAA